MAGIFNLKLAIASKRISIKIFLQLFYHSNFLEPINLEIDKELIIVHQIVTSSPKSDPVFP